MSAFSYIGENLSVENLNLYLVIAVVFVVCIVVIILIIKRKKVKSKDNEQVSSLQEKLAKTKNGFLGKLAEIVRLRGKVNEDLMGDLEEMLLQADVGVKASIDIIEKLREEIRLNQIKKPQEIQKYMEKIMRDLLLKDYSAEQDHLKITDRKPFIILFAGVNGVGKTTTIGKLAKRFTLMGKSVMLIAGDTFRAAAVEQVSIWAERAGASIVKQQQGADPSSVVYDGVMSAVNKKIDVVLIDTAGRQHTKVNLMNELSKIVRTIQKIVPDGPHETLLVVDATTGQNAITQAEIFNEATKLSGLVLTKLDGTAKGGIVIGIKHQLNIPVKLIGVGETVADLRDFDVNEFVDAIFE
ncbi:MAG: signal recognition particle-docking protein FtsY [Candidatus Cloacimonadales bacterium]|nr:signal recognition particle-docking protein FtsY [Candidatus Cloacimonadales bacterium]